MKQKHDVSIAGIAFQLDDEGYLLLDNYLSQIAAIYKNNPDGAEVLADIEGRICELILERQPADRPVPIELLRHIVEQLGMPDSFPEETIPTSNSHISNCPEQENASAQTDSQSHTSSNTSGENTANTQSRLNQPPTDMPRRLYRNAENARIGGVCSGLGTFFRVDPIVFRLCFLLPLPLTMLVAVIPGISAMTGFFGVLFAISIVAYPLLWFAIPMARTPRQKLEMRGEAITATTIQKSVQKGHLPNKKTASNRTTAALSTSDQLLSILGNIILFILKFIGVIIAGALLIGGLCIAVASLTGYANTNIASINLFSIESDSLLDFLFVPIVIAIPLLAISYLLLALIFKWPTPKRKTFSILTGIWLILVVFATIFFIRAQVNSYKDSDHQGLLELIIDDIQNESSEAESDPQIPIQSNQPIIKVEQIKVNDSIVTDTIRTEYFLKE